MNSQPSMAGFRGVRRESQWGTVLITVPNQAAKTAMNQARTSCNVFLAMQARKLR
ncbi:MAG: hypothetical protein U9P07_08045 [Pseudomonadota bacterium]|nr:hypothetical protein [Pseudomonadota bacterium]